MKKKKKRKKSLNPLEFLSVFKKDLKKKDSQTVFIVAGLLFIVTLSVTFYVLTGGFSRDVETLLIGR